MKNRTVLVTGASRGIGAATAILLGRHGAAVAVNYCRSAAAAAAVVGDIEAAGGRALAVAADVRDPEQVRAMVARVSAELGLIDTLVINAAIGFPIKPFVEQSWSDFEAKVVGEIGAAFACVQEVVPAMKERGGGCIIAVSSRMSRHALRGFSAHSTAKSGLDALMRSLAVELGPLGIRVNVVAPGLILTDATAFLSEEQKRASAAATPLGRVGDPADVAGVILALARQDAAFVSGAYVPVSGGTQLM